MKTQQDKQQQETNQQILQDSLQLMINLFR